MVCIFSVKRLILSIILGILLPLAYLFALSLVFDHSNKIPPNFLIMPIGWPRPVWIFLMGRQPTEADLVIGMTFMIGGNIMLYGALSYVGLLALSIIRKDKRTDFDAPPPPPDLSRISS